MVNGGYEYLAENGVPTQNGASEPVPCEVTVTAINEDNLINTDDLAANYDNYVVVDAVSYTHLDVYKRQVFLLSMRHCCVIRLWMMLISAACKVFSPAAILCPSN